MSLLAVAKASSHAPVLLTSHRLSTGLLLCFLTVFTVKRSLLAYNSVCIHRLPFTVSYYSVASGRDLWPTLVHNTCPVGRYLLSSVCLHLTVSGIRLV